MTLKKIGGIILAHLGELWNYIQRVGFISPDFTSLKVRCLVWASPLGFICNSRSKKGMCAVSHPDLNQVSQAVGWNYPLEMLSPSEQRGSLQNQLRQGTQLLNGWTEVKAALTSRRFYWNHRGEGKLFNVEYRVMCIAVTAPPWRRINLYRLKLQYSVEPACKKHTQKGAGWRKKRVKIWILCFLIRLSD